MAGLHRRAGGGGGSSVQYHPPPSIGHEIGVIFAGIGCMLLGAALFYLWWRVKLVKELKWEEDRVADLRARGLLGSDEKRGVDVGAVGREEERET